MINGSIRLNSFVYEKYVEDMLRNTFDRHFSGSEVSNYGVQIPSYGFTTSAQRRARRRIPIESMGIDPDLPSFFNHQQPGV